VLEAEQHYVLPTTLEDVTAFCSKLTGISRELVQTRGEPLQAVVTRLEQGSVLEGSFPTPTCLWLTACHLFFHEVCRALPSQRSVTLLCDGRWDVHFMLQKETRAKGIHVEEVTICIMTVCDWDVPRFRSWVFRRGVLVVVANLVDAHLIIVCACSPHCGASTTI
jgi:hypothetical protein